MPDDNEEINFQGFKNPEVKRKLHTLDVFAGVGGKQGCCGGVGDKQEVVWEVSRGWCGR